MRHLIILLSLICFANGAMSQQLNQSSHWYDLTKVETVSLSSNFTDREYKIHISYSFDSITPGVKYPVLYYTDAWECTEMATLFAKALEGFGETNPFILVGISFDADINSFMELRQQDFIPDLKDNEENGATHFLKFIEVQLIPFVEANYPVDASDRGYYGYSWGATFGAWVLRQKPALFQKMGLGSATNEVKELLSDDIFLSNLKNAKNLKIFSSYGTIESFAGANRDFQSMLKNNPNIESEDLAFAGDSHATAWPGALMRAMKFLYRK